MRTGAEDGPAFPVQWEDPADAGASWFFDITHTPGVMTPLGYDLYYGPFISGFRVLRTSYVNRYVYMTAPPIPPGVDFAQPPVDLPRLVNGAARWRNEIIPETVRHVEYYRDTDFESMPNDALAREIEELRELRVHQGELHELALRPYSVGMNHLIATYKELTSGDDLGAVRLVQGYGSKSVEAGTRLWELSRVAAGVPSVRTAIERVDGAPAGGVLAWLENDPPAREFAEEFRAFLDDFGWRSELFEFAKPTWAEDLSIPLAQLRLYLDLPGYDPGAEQRRLAADRAAAIAEAMARLEPKQRERLVAAIDVAKEVVPIQEDHNYYIDQRWAMMPRRLALAAGRRLAAKGALDDASDVFYLSGDDLLAALAGKLENVGGLVSRCKDEMAYWSRVTPPANIGAEREDAMKELPFTASVRHRERANELRGNGASPGVVRAPARVLMSLHEADRLKPGDILVARTTMPPWTPLFAVAGGLVTETGGVLSHPAVTAREYAIPAVLGVADATRLIKDGQLLEVDGNTGLVRILASS